MDKKAALIYIYKILCEQTDNNHSLTQEEIAKILKEKYGLELERKGISRNLKLINEAGFEVGGINSRKGSYLFRDFMNSELIFLNECVRSNPSLTKRWNVFTVWECQLKAGAAEETLMNLAEWIRNNPSNESF